MLTTALLGLVFIGTLLAVNTWAVFHRESPLAQIALKRALPTPPGRGSQAPEMRRVARAYFWSTAWCLALAGAAGALFLVMDASGSSATGPGGAVLLFVAFVGACLSAPMALWVLELYATVGGRALRAAWLRHRSVRKA